MYKHEPQWVSLNQALHRFRRRFKNTAELVAAIRECNQDAKTTHTIQVRGRKCDRSRLWVLDGWLCRRYRREYYRRRKMQSEAGAA